MEPFFNNAVLRKIAPPLVIAEAGVNHNGRVDLAMEMIEVAADAGADAIKFQTFKPEKLVTRGTKLGSYQKAGCPDAMDQFGMLEGLILSPSELEKLAARARALDLLFLSTPFDDTSLQLLVELGIPMVKLSSGDLTNFSLLDAANESGLPLILSTGMASREEIRAALDRVGHDPARVALLQCTSVYPCPVSEAHTAGVAWLREQFGVTTGFSDHTLGSIAACTAIAFGAAILEKHFTLDRNLPGPDHQASASPNELRAYVQAVRDARSSLGQAVKEVREIEMETRRIGRRGLYWTDDLPSAHVICPNDLVALRPETGIYEADAYPSLLGARLARAVHGGSPVQREDLLR